MTSKQKIRTGQFGFQLLEEIFKVQRLMSSGCLDPDFHHKPAGATAKPRNQEIKNHSLVVTFLILKFSDCTMDVVLAFKRLFSTIHLLKLIKQDTLDQQKPVCSFEVPLF